MKQPLIPVVAGQSTTFLRCSEKKQEYGGNYDPPYSSASNEISISYTPKKYVCIFKQKSVKFCPQAAQLQHTQLRLVLLCTTDHQFLLTPYCIHTELNPKASSFLQGVHLIAVASASLVISTSSLWVRSRVARIPSRSDLLVAVCISSLVTSSVHLVTGKRRLLFKVIRNRC